MNKFDSYIWKERRLTDDRSEVQTTYKLIDFNDIQLNVAYDQCKQMLYNQDSNKPGRMIVLQNIQKQLNNCNAELAIRYFKSLNDKDGNAIYSDSSLIDDIRSWTRAIENNNSINDKSLVFIGDIISVPVEYKNVKLSDLYLASRDMLGTFDYSKISYNFIYKLGIYFTSEDLKEYSKGKNKIIPSELLEILRDDLVLSNSIPLYINPNGLSAKEFRDMIYLKKKTKNGKCKYSELTTTQLKTLRNKVLYNFEDLIIKQSNIWKTLMSQIEEVAEYKGYILK